MIANHYNFKSILFPKYYKPNLTFFSFEIIEFQHLRELPFAVFQNILEKTLN